MIISDIYYVIDNESMEIFISDSEGKDYSIAYIDIICVDDYDYDDLYELAYEIAHELGYKLEGECQ